MNKIVNKFLLEGDKFMPEMHLKQPDLLIVPVVHLPKTKKELKSLFTEMSLIKLVFNMIWLMVNQKI